MWRPADITGMFEWNSNYITGIGSIDAQHQTLFQIANKLYEAMSTGQGRAALGPLLQRLVQYTASHFAHEERLMRANNYPDFAAHKAQHDALTRQVQEFNAKYQAGQAAMTVQVLHFLKNWLVDHIKGTDMKYAPFLTSKAVA
ncbi:MAG TPA: bacteriohemerythrin [Candidatus Sulfopaludibacter sp.]|jgi:hemerythrin-like metal-binding protein|nr:bacteriohemerythrin [Candidatus Sulfopaludibacter sp.]